MATSPPDLDDTPCNEFNEARLELSMTEKTASPAGDLFTGAQNRPSTLGMPRPILKPAFSEPLNVLSPAFTPPTPEDVGQGFYTHEGLSRSFYQQPPIGGTRRYSWHSSTPLPPHPQLQFFSIRTGALSRAVMQCRSLTDEVLDGDMRGVWLLTQINHWDLELERLVMLCDYSLLIFKYDFIALKPVNFTRLELRSLSKAVLGELVYPQRSLVPILSGIAGGVMSVLRSVFFPRLHSTLRTIASTASKASSNIVSKSAAVVPPNTEEEESNKKESHNVEGSGKKVIFKEDKTIGKKVADDSDSCSDSTGITNSDTPHTSAEPSTAAVDDTNEDKTKSGAFSSAFSNVSFDSKCRDLPGLRLFTLQTNTMPQSLLAAPSSLFKQKTIAGGNSDPSTTRDEFSKQGENSSPKRQSSEDKDEGSNVSWQQKWNPFCCTLPYHTLTSHPLYWYTTNNDASTYDVVDLANKLSKALQELSDQPDTAEVCSLKVSKVLQHLMTQQQVRAVDDTETAKAITDSSSSAPPSGTNGSPYSKIRTSDDEEDNDEDKLVVENYLGVVSLLHNASQLGYFKMRGKISF